MKAAEVPYEVVDKTLIKKHTTILERRFGLSETAKLDLRSKTHKAHNYVHMETPDWQGHVILDDVFVGKKVYFRCQEYYCDRLFLSDGKYAHIIINTMGGGRGIVYLTDLSFIIVDNSSYILIYDGERNAFFQRADQLISNYYKKVGIVKSV